MSARAMHADFAFISQAHVAPIVKRYTKYRECAPRFEIATGIVPVEPKKQRVAEPFTEAELHEPVAPVPHPRNLPHDHPDYLAWFAKASAKARITRRYKPRPCECCPYSFTPVSGIQKHCPQCVATIPKNLRCASGRMPRHLAQARAQAGRLC